jgi:tRNA (guanine37-N1)-methyltransferase
MTNPLWQSWVLSIFPEMLPGPLAFSLAGRALENDIWRLNPVDIRDFARDKHRSVDAAPMGGGPGMVMRADVLAAALDAVKLTAAHELAQQGLDGEVPVVYLSPRGRRFDQAMAREFAEKPGLIAICGRFEGVDQRVLDGRNIQEVSIGDFVLSGGEPAAITLIDAVVRLLPGVIGEPAALEDESFAAARGGLLEYPQYTRPQEWEGRKVPEVLLSGHHQRVKEWRQAAAEELTKQRRPDLWRSYEDETSDD